MTSASANSLIAVVFKTRLVAAKSVTTFQLAVAVVRVDSRAAVAALKVSKLPYSVTMRAADTILAATSAS